MSVLAELIAAQAALRLMSEDVNTPFRSEADVARLFSLSDFDEMLRTQNWVRRHLRMSRDGEPVAAREFEDAAGRIDLPAVWDAFAGGASIVLHHLERGVPRLARLTRELADGVEGRAWVTGYISPPRHGAFARHADEHHVLVLQVGGVKTWRVEAEVRDGPAPDAAVLHAADRDITLSAGEILFLPRGARHWAVSGSEVSTHLSVGFRRNTWSEMLTTFMDEQSGPWSLPATRAGEDAFEDDLEDLLGHLRGALGKGRRCEATRARRLGLREEIFLAHLDSAAILRGRRQDAFNMTVDDEIIVVINGGYRVELAALLRPVVEHLARGGDIVLAELEEVFDEMALKEFVSAMVRTGLADVGSYVDNDLVPI